MVPLLLIIDVKNDAQHSIITEEVKEVAKNVEDKLRPIRV